MIEELSRSRGKAIWPMTSAGIICSVLVWSLAQAVVPPAQRPAPTEYEVKAAYLFYFGKFVEWPGGAMAALPDPFTICVLGQDPFGVSLDRTVAGETIGGKTVVPKRIARVEEAADCQILFVSSSEAGRLKDVLTSLDKAAILTVSDLQQFVQRGGMIQFTMQRSRVRFEVNLTAAQNAGLALHSELLKVAVAVRKNPAGQ